MDIIGFSTEFGNNYTGFKYGFAHFVSSLNGELFDIREFYLHPVFYKDMDQIPIIHLPKNKIHLKFLRHAVVHSEINFFIYIDWDLEQLDSSDPITYNNFLKIIEMSKGVFYIHSNQTKVYQLTKNHYLIKYDYDYNFGKNYDCSVKYPKAVLLLYKKNIPLSLINYAETKLIDYDKYFMFPFLSKQFLINKIITVKWKYGTSAKLKYIPKLLSQFKYCICDSNIVFDKYEQICDYYKVDLHNLNTDTFNNKQYTPNNFEEIQKWVKNKIKK